MGEWGAECSSQFSSEMSFAPGEERPLAEKWRSAVLDVFLFFIHADTQLCHRIHSQRVETRRAQMTRSQHCCATMGGRFLLI